MSTEYGYKVDGWGSSWNTPDHMAEGRRVGRFNKLKALLDALKLGNLQASQTALDDLWGFDPLLRNDPYLIKIGEAITKRMLYLAQKTASAMQADPNHFSSSAFAKNFLSSAVKSTSSDKGAGRSQHTVSVLPISTASTVNLEMSPRKATSGEFGRIIDVTA